MLDTLQVIVLALVQGLTEFLPVSSSAHLILVSELLGWPDQGLAFDIAVHLGTLVAVLVYFRQDLCQMGAGFLAVLQRKKITAEAKKLLHIALATIPVGLVGLMIRQMDPNYFRSTLVIAFATIGFGLLLGVADRRGRRQRALNEMKAWDVLMIGCFQALSLIPGTSRSGITLTAGLFRGFSREAAAQFSFLLSIPVIILASGLEIIKLTNSSVVVDWNALGLGAVIAALSGYFCIHYFMKMLEKVGVLPFVIYRLFLGVFLIGFSYFC
jgi:undecaprenyl-diphosphatase